MKYRGHMDYDHPDDALEVDADSRRKAAEKIAELLDRGIILNEDEIPGSRTIIVWPVINEFSVMEYYDDRRREFIVSPRITYYAKATDGGDL